MDFEAIHKFQKTLWAPKGASKEFLEDCWKKLGEQKKYRYMTYYGKLYTDRLEDVGWVELRSDMIMIWFHGADDRSDQFDFYDSACYQARIFEELIEDFMKLTGCTEFKNKT